MIQQIPSLSNYQACSSEAQSSHFYFHGLGFQERTASTSVRRRRQVQASLLTFFPWPRFRLRLWLRLGVSPFDARAEFSSNAFSLQSYGFFLEEEPPCCVLPFNLAFFRIFRHISPSRDSQKYLHRNHHWKRGVNNFLSLYW